VLAKIHVLAQIAADETDTCLRTVSGVSIAARSSFPTQLTARTSVEAESVLLPTSRTMARHGGGCYRVHLLHVLGVISYTTPQPQDVQALRNKKNLPVQRGSARESGPQELIGPESATCFHQSEITIACRDTAGCCRQRIVATTVLISDGIQIFCMARNCEAAPHLRLRAECRMKGGDPDSLVPRTKRWRHAGASVI